MTSRLAPVVMGLVGLPLAVLCPGGGAEDPKDSAADRVKVVRATYQPVPPTILRTKEPIRVTQFSEQQLPKCIILVAVDADEKSHRFDWWLDKEKSSNREYDRIYWYPTGTVSEGPFRLPHRGPEEAALYGLMLRWAEATEEKKGTLNLFDKSMLNSVNTLLEKLDERFAGERPALQR